MRIVCRMVGVAGACRLHPITAAHIDGCAYFGISMLDFAECDGHATAGATP